MTISQELVNIRDAARSFVRGEGLDGRFPRRIPIMFAPVPSEAGPAMSLHASVASVADRFGDDSREVKNAEQFFRGGAELVCVTNPIAIVNALEALDDARHVFTALASLDPGEPMPEAVRERVLSACRHRR